MRVRVMSLVLALVAALLGGCATVPMGDAKQDASLKTFQVAPDRAALYVYRNESMGAAIKMDVQLDGKQLGQTVANSYIFADLKPGQHTLVSSAENTDTLQFEAKPGQAVYVWQEVKMGVLYARNKLHLVAEQEGRKGVLETKLIASPVGAVAAGPAATAGTSATTSAGAPGRTPVMRTASVTVLPDTEAIVREPASGEADCSARPAPVLTWVSAPQHGDAEVRPGTVTGQSNVNGNSKCAGNQYQGLQVVYRPKPGFHGNDELVYRTDSGLTFIEFHVSVRVP